MQPLLLLMNACSGALKSRGEATGQVNVCLTWKDLVLLARPAAMQRASFQHATRPLTLRGSVLPGDT
jgi:hypothetical protein